MAWPDHACESPSPVHIQLLACRLHASLARRLVGICHGDKDTIAARLRSRKGEPSASLHLRHWRHFKHVVDPVKSGIADMEDTRVCQMFPRATESERGRLPAGLRMDTPAGSAKDSELDSCSLSR